MEELILQYGAWAEYGIPTLGILLAVGIAMICEEKFHYRNKRGDKLNGR